MAKVINGKTMAIIDLNKVVQGCSDEDELIVCGGDSQHDQNGHACTPIGDGGRFLSQAGFSGMSLAQR